MSRSSDRSPVSLVLADDKQFLARSASAAEYWKVGCRAVQPVDKLVAEWGRCLTNSSNIAFRYCIISKARLAEARR